MSIDLKKVEKLEKLINLISKRNLDDETVKNMMDTHYDIKDELKKFMIKFPTRILHRIKDIKDNNKINEDLYTKLLIEYFYPNKSILDLQKEYVEKQFQLAEKEFKEKYNKEYIYTNQKETAQNIINEFLINNKKAVSLVALPQVGKTGTFLYTAYLASTFEDNNKVIPPDNIFIITGMSDREWQKQTEDDMIDSFKKNVFHHGKLSKFGKKIKEKEGQNILIIIDECHIATRKGQEMDEIFRDILKIIDKKDINEIKNLKFLNVSATPGSVLRSLEKWGNDYHSTVYIKPSDKYVGFKKFLEQERLYDSDEINKDYLYNTILKIMNLRYKDNPKFHIFRTNNLEKIGILEEFCKKLGYKCYHHNSNSRRNFDEEIKNVPENHTFVIIKGFYRAGKRLIDKNIGIAYEHNSDINFDITPQGLIGRFCGNDKMNSEDNSPYFICNKETIKGYLDFIDNGCNGDYISKNYKIVDNRVIKENETYADNIKNSEFIDKDKYSKKDYINIPHVFDISIDEYNFYKNIDKNEKINFIKKIIKNDKYLLEIIKKYKKTQISQPKTKESYQKHIKDPIRNYENKTPYILDLQKENIYNNVWMAFMDNIDFSINNKLKLIILVYHGEKFKELTEQNEIVSESDDNTIKIKNNKKIKIKSKVPCKKQEK
jgi:hypothetical protein